MEIGKTLVKHLRGKSGKTPKNPVKHSSLEIPGTPSIQRRAAFPHAIALQIPSDSVGILKMVENYQWESVFYHFGSWVTVKHFTIF